MQMNTYLFLFPYLQGTKLEVRGLQNTPRHVDVPIQQCSDPDNFKYPNGLVCAGEACKLTNIILLGFSVLIQERTKEVKKLRLQFCLKIQLDSDNFPGLLKNISKFFKLYSS